MADAGRGRLVILGAGGHAKVMIETLREARPDLSLVGCLASAATPGGVVGAPILGDDALIDVLRAQGVDHAVVALGDNQLRARLGARLTAAGYVLPPVVSPGARVSPSARVGAGAAIFAGAIVQAEADIAALAIVNTSASIDHEAQVGEAAHIAPGAVLTGAVRIGARALIGAGAVVTPNVEIGADAVVGAGACVVRDVPAETRVAGVPARPLTRRGD